MVACEPFLLEGLFCTVDDFVLEFAAEVVEVVAVTSNSYNQVFVFVRVLLGGQQGAAVNDVELNVVAVQAEI